MATPIGTVIAYAGDANKQKVNLDKLGWLLCDGNPISRTTYADLYEIIKDSCGEGDGTTTFNLPDYRGRFLRGTDHTAHRDPDTANRTAMQNGGVTGNHTGSVQDQATKLPTSTAFTTNTTGAHSHSVQHVPTDSSSYKIAGSSYAKWNSGSVNTSTEGDHHHTILGGDNETRPVNAYVDYLIQYKTT